MAQLITENHGQLIFSTSAGPATIVVPGPTALKALVGFSSSIANTKIAGSKAVASTDLAGKKTQPTFAYQIRRTDVPGTGYYMVTNVTAAETNLTKANDAKILKVATIQVSFHSNAAPKSGNPNPKDQGTENSEYAAYVKDFIFGSTTADLLNIPWVKTEVP